MTSGLLADLDATQLVRLGHFEYESGDHGDTWLALDLLFADPRRLEGAAETLSEKLAVYEVDLVCAPLVGGALVGQRVAYALKARFVFAERQPDASGPGARYAIPPGRRGGLSGKRVIVVDDAINAGSATLACVREVEALGGRVVALAGLIVRAAAVPEMRRRLGVPVEALVALDWRTWPSSDCPLCRSGVALSPGP